MIRFIKRLLAWRPRSYWIRKAEEREEFLKTTYPDKWREYQKYLFPWLTGDIVFLQPPSFAQWMDGVLPSKLEPRIKRLLDDAKRYEDRKKYP